MTGRPVKVKRMACMISEVIMLTASIMLYGAPTATAQSTFAMSYSARLTNASGAPLEGPVAVKATFWNAATGGQQLGPVLSFDAAPLTNGVLNVELGLNSSQINDVFGDGSHSVYIELTAADKTYPRQMYSFVPLALRVPFDDKNLKFNDSGKLTLAVGTKPNANSFLTQDANGALSWGMPSSNSSAIADADIAEGAAISQSKISGLSAALAAKEAAIAAGTTSQYFRGDKTWHALTSTAVAEGGTNLYYTDARARSSLVPSGPITYSVVSGTIGISQASGSTDGYMSSADWATFNGKQASLGYSPVNKSGDTMLGVLDMSSNDINSAGNIGMAASKTLLLSNNATDPAGLTAADKGRTWFNSASNEIKYWDGTAAKSLGVAGSGLHSFNGLTTNVQTFAVPGTAGTAPAWTSTGSAHTLNIPLASTSSVTAGLLSNADYTALNNKLNAVSNGTGISTTTGSGTVTVSLANTSVTAGTYARANITVDAQGRLTAAQSAPTIVDSDISNTAAISQSKISGLNTSLAGKEDAIAAGTNSQYFRGDKTWQDLNTAAVPESGANQYYTDARSRASLTPAAPVTYSIVTGTIGINQASGSANGYLSSADWATFNGKQNSLGYAPLNKAGDTMTGALDLGSGDLKNTGNLSMSASKSLLLSNNATDPTGLTAADKGKTWFNSASNEIKYWDGAATKSLGIAGSGLQSLNGLTTNVQTFAVPGTAGTAPAWTSTGSAHTLNIPLASTSSVTAGLLSNADYTTFNNKISSVAAGTGLTGGGSSGAVTLNADVGTTANKLVQLDANAKMPSVDGSALTNLNPSNLAGVVGVAKGGTGLSSGTSGGVPYFNANNTLASSAALVSNGVVLGGGAGAAPVTTAAGAANSVLRVPSAGGAPAFGAIDLTQSSAVNGVLGILNGGLGTSLSLTGGSGQYLKQSASGSAVTVGTIAAADIPSMVGDSGAGGTKGAVPAPASGDAAAGKFLKADGTWTNPSTTVTWGAPGAIGTTTPNSGAFTTLNTSGNVGIGTNAPQSKLDVYANGTGLSLEPGNGTTFFGTLGFNREASNGNIISAGHNAYQFTNFDSSFQLEVYNGGGTAVTYSALAVNSAGNVGIGTTAPSGKLSISDGTNTLGVYPGHYWSGTADVSASGWVELDQPGQQNLNISDNLIVTGGNVGIGSTSPTAALDVNGQIKIQGGTPGVGKVLTSDANGLASWGSAAVGTITGLTAGSGLTGGGTSGNVTLSADVGTSANKLVQLDASAKLPAVDGSALTNLNSANLSSAVSVVKGGTGLNSGISGGVPYFNATSTMASSAALNANGVVLGGGAGAAPTSTMAGSPNSVLRVPAAGGAPAFGAIDLSQSAAFSGVLNIGNGGLGASLLVTGGTGQYLKQTASGANVTVGTIAAADLPSMIGDSGSGGTKGAVPAPASGDSAAGKFLKADGSWSVPSSTVNWAAPGTIGSTTPNAGVFTTLKTSGSVGVGTTAPAALLDVGGTMRVSSVGTISSEGTKNTNNGMIETNYGAGNRYGLGQFTNGVLALYTADTYAPSSIAFGRMTSTSTFVDLVHIDHGGNVGIGTTTPDALLTVGIATSASGLYPSTAGISLRASNSTTTKKTGLYLSNADDLSVYTLDNLGIYQKWNGNVGIGTTAPAANLEVMATASNATPLIAKADSNATLPLQISINGYTNPNQQLMLGYNTTSNYGSIQSILQGTGAKPLALNPYGGNVGIGTTAPSSQLHVAATLPNSGPEIKIENLSATTASAGYRLKNTTRNWGIFVRGDASNVLAFQDDTASAIRMAIDGSGNVGIGLTNPTANLHVNGQVAVVVPSSNVPSATTQTVDWSKGNIQIIDLSSATGNVTVTFTNAVAGASYGVKIIQGSTVRNITWPAAVKWPGGVTYAVSSISGAVDFVMMFFDGSTYYASAGKNYQ